MSQTLTGRIKPHLSMGYKDESRRQSLGLSNKALIIPMYIREPDKIGFEPMVLGSTVYFKYTTFDHSVIYPQYLKCLPRI